LDFVQAEPVLSSITFPVFIASSKFFMNHDQGTILLHNRYEYFSHLEKIDDLVAELFKTH
jgi:hypothetical protein